MRSSWEASARKRRSRSSDAARSAKATSISSIMVLKAWPSWPTSVPSATWDTRWDRSPWAMAPAVSVISSSGRRSRRTMTQDSIPRPISTSPETISSMSSRWRRVLSRSVSGTATTITPLAVGQGLGQGPIGDRVAGAGGGEVEVGPGGQPGAGELGRDLRGDRGLAPVAEEQVGFDLARWRSAGARRCPGGTSTPRAAVRDCPKKPPPLRNAPAGSDRPDPRRTRCTREVDGGAAGTWGPSPDVDRRARPTGKAATSSCWSTRVVRNDRRSCR